MFALASPEPVKARTTKCACGGRNCQSAKKIRCVCRCHSTNHGSENRRGMDPLEKALGLEETGARRLGDLGLNLELSGRLELEGMI